MSAEIADKPTRPAIAAFAGAVLGIDVCFAYMIEPDTRLELKSVALNRRASGRLAESPPSVKRE